LSIVHFAHPAQQIAFEEYRQAVKETHARLERLTEQLREQCAHWRMNPLLTALMCLRGFDFVAAATFVAEVGDPRRFSHPRELMAYLGLVPSEYSSGETRHQGPITKTGNKHARRMLVEAAWNYRHTARVSRVVEVRQQGQPKAVGDIALACATAPDQTLPMPECAPPATQQSVRGDRLRTGGLHLGYIPPSYPGIGVGDGASCSSPAKKR